MVAVNWIRKVLCILLVSGCIAPSIFAQKNDPIFKLTDSVYARIVSPNGNAVGNSGFIVIRNSVIVFDTHFTPEAGRQLLYEIRSVTNNPVRYVVNSHFHPDHTHGNQVFVDAHIIGNQETRHGILQKDQQSLNRSIGITSDQLEKMQNEAKKEANPARLDSMQQKIASQKEYLETLLDLNISAPLVVMDEYLGIQEEGSSEIQIQFLGPGHTDSDTILFLPSEKVVFCGDLFFNTAIPNVQDATILKWMETLQRLLELDADVFIPGHGPVGDRQDVLKFLEYFEDLRALVDPFVVSGYSNEEAMMAIQLPLKYSRYRFKNFFQTNIQTMYAELKAELLLSIPIEGPKLPKKEI